MSDNNGAAEMTNETNTTSIAPLPCPFCGRTSVSVKEGSTFRWRIAYCNECDAQAGEVRAQTSGDGRPNEWEAAAIDRAIAEWNIRDYAAEIDRLRARVADGFDLIAHLTRQREFSERTFGPGVRTKGVVDHIRKELIEIEAKPDDLSEWVDVILLALDGAWRTGHTPQQICEGMTAKQVKNEARTWPDWRTADPNKAIEHDRSKDGA